MNGIFIQFYKHKEMVTPVIEGLLDTIDRKNNFIVAIDNLSSNSPEIRPSLKKYHEEGKLDRCYFMDDNYIFNAMREVVKDVLSKTPLDYITITDGDVIPPKLSKCWVSTFIDYFNEYDTLGGIGFSTDLHHQTPDELKENAYDFERVYRASNLRCIKGTVPHYIQSEIHFSEKYNQIDNDVIESLPMFQYYMIKASIISSYLEQHPNQTLGDGHISKFILKGKHKIFRYESTPAKNLTYDSEKLLESGYNDYKKERSNLVSSFQNYKKVKGWEVLE